MGSVRRGLIIGGSLVLIPVMAHADVCGDFRPDWDGGTVSAWAEMIALFSTPISLVLLLGTALVVRFRNAWGGLAMFVGWSFAVGAVTFMDPTGGVRARATAEGCVGSPTLYIVIVAAICAGMMLYLNRVADTTRDAD